MKHAYVTLITNSKYLPGALVLAKSLRNTNTEIPFFVLLPRDITPVVVADLEKHQIAYLFFDDGNETGIVGSGYWKDTLAKLKIFDLTDFEKLVFLDADMIIMRNLDDLFAYPHMSAVCAGKELHTDWTALNSGLMVIEPKHTDYLGMLDLVEEVYQDRIGRKLPFGDQDVINRYYSFWPDKKTLHLPSKMNVMLGYGGILKKQGIIQGASEIAVYHYTGKQKPWGSLIDNLIVLLKILKRSSGWAVDLQVYRAYRKLLRTVK